MASLFASCGGAMSRKPQYQFLNDMRQQPKYQPQGQSDFDRFHDGRADRRPIAGTIARGQLHDEDDPFYTGQVKGMYIAQNPLKITAETLELGQQRFNTYCSPCHGRAGNGKGIVGARTNWIPSSLVEDRVKGFSDGDIFDVITHGRRSMPSYRFQITEHDRWAIICLPAGISAHHQRHNRGRSGQLRSELR